MNNQFGIGDLVKSRNTNEQGRIISYKTLKNGKIAEIAFLVRHRNNKKFYFKEEIEGIIIG